jgi:exfoliative toxin A/B
MNRRSRAIKSLLQILPLPIAGLMLASASVGNLIASYGSMYKNIFGVISALILLLLIGKIITDKKSVVEGLNNPVIASVMPTFSMGIMILSTYIKAPFPTLALISWCIGLLLHCIFIVFFTCKYIFKFDIKKVFPSYFIVYVGIVCASVTAPVFNLATLGRFIFWFGFVAYIILLPIVLYRVFVVKGILEPILPTIAIFAAPANLCLAGYMNSFQDKNMYIVGILTFLGLLMTLSVLLYMPKLLKLKFYPSYSSLTFPLVISGIGIKLTNGFFISTNKPIALFKYIVKLEEIIGVLIVVYVLIRYVQFLFTNTKAYSKNNKSVC